MEVNAPLAHHAVGMKLVLVLLLDRKADHYERKVDDNATRVTISEVAAASFRPGEAPVFRFQRREPFLVALAPLPQLSREGWLVPRLRLWPVPLPTHQSNPLSMVLADKQLPIHSGPDLPQCPQPASQ